MINIFKLCLLMGCAQPEEGPLADDIASRPEGEELIPPDDPWSYKPDMVMFHNVAVINEGNQIACFDDGDGTPYCGVYKVILTIWDEWEGLSDSDSCQIIHRVAPEYLIENEVSQDFAAYNTRHAWEFDASQSFVSTTQLCDMIAEDSDIANVVEKFKTENVAFGYKELSEDMAAEYKNSFGSNYTDEEWAAEVQPYLLGMTNRIEGVYRTPNVGVVYEIDEDNQLVVDENDTWNRLIFEGTEEVPTGYYRAPSYYVYDIGTFVPEEIGE